MGEWTNLRMDERMKGEPGGVIVRVAPGSLAEELALRPGDVLLRINGRPVRDVVDVRFYAAEDRVTLLVRRGAEETYYEADKDPDELLGLEFAEPVFDGVRRCANACAFCFVDQMPPGLRPSLYIKDDDLRLSFLYGNFLSLTNLTPADWDRLAEQRLSPLYVSVHATDPDLRARMFGNPRAAGIIDDLRRLGNLGIQTHVQIVVCPGLNDGPHLERTLTDLAGLYPTVQSVAVVPVGLTRFHRGGTSVRRSVMRPVTPAAARVIVRTVERWHRRCRADWGVGWVYPSDELYLLAGRRTPARRRYDGFPQLENGVGLVRLLLDDAKRTLNPKPQTPSTKSAICNLQFAICNLQSAICNLQSAVCNLQSAICNLQLVCGTLIAPTLQRLVDSLGVSWTVLPVENRFFGPMVTVSGLLTAEDVLDTLVAAPLADAVALPRAMFDAAGECTLDDVTPAEMEARLGRPVLLASTLRDVVDSQSH